MVFSKIETSFCLSARRCSPLQQITQPSPSFKYNFLMGNQHANISHLIQPIDNHSKIDHILTISDVWPKDKQNYSSCEKISNDTVLSILKKIPNSEATQAYLQVIFN